MHIAVVKIGIKRLSKTRRTTPFCNSITFNWERLYKYSPPNKVFDVLASTPSIQGLVCYDYNDSAGAHRRLEAVARRSAARRRPPLAAKRRQSPPLSGGRRVAPYRFASDLQTGDKRKAF